MSSRISDGLLITGPVCHINDPTAPGVIAVSDGATARAIPLTAAQVVVAAVVTVNTAKQVFIAQQAATAAAIAATLPTKLNMNNLSPKAKSRY